MSACSLHHLPHQLLWHHLNPLHLLDLQSSLGCWHNICNVLLQVHLLFFSFLEANVCPLTLRSISQQVKGMIAESERAFLKE